MKLRVVSTRSEVDRLNPNEKMVHLAFRASNVDIIKLVQRCPRLRAIQIPHSYRKTMSKAIEVFLGMQDIEILEGDIWGHRKDLNEYYTVEEDTINEIRSMTDRGVALEEIMDKIRNTARLGPDLVKYIARTKITT